MYIYKIKIEGFKKIEKAELMFGNCSFLIGENNSGKSSVLKAVKYLLSNNKKISEDEYLSVDSSEGKTQPLTKLIVIEAEFRNIPIELKTTSGFKGRIFEYSKTNEKDTGLSITIRKTYPLGEDFKIEIQSQERIGKEFLTYQDVLNLGLSNDDLINCIGEAQIPDLSKKVPVAHRRNLESHSNLYECTEKIVWDINPLGIYPSFARYLPRFIEIPALHSFDDLNGGKTTTAIGEILNIMFEEVRSKSTNYNEAQKYLTALEKEMNPSDGNTEFGKLIENVNSGFEKVFSRARFHVSVDLSSPQDSIKPQFKTAFSSNIKTKVENQGTGLSRSAIFSLLKFRADWLHEKESKLKTSLFIAFEEPELYLHPAAIRQIREFIYEISESGETQIVCSTHSANMIDLSREKILQVINLLKVEQREFPFDDKVVQIETPRPFIIAHSTIMSQLEENDRSFLKMLLKVDQSIAESFFCERTIIIEGDTEQVVLSETLNRVPREQKDRILKKHNIVRARGKIIIKPLVKYLKALGIDYRVIHDKDNGKDGQENANELIKAEAGADNVYVIDDCIETVLGYSPPSKEKPYKAYQHIQKNWGNDSTKMSDEWKKILKFLFNESF